MMLAEKAWSVPGSREHFMSSRCRKIFSAVMGQSDGMLQTSDLDLVI